LPCSSRPPQTSRRRPEGHDGGSETESLPPPIDLGAAVGGDGAGEVVEHGHEPSRNPRSGSSDIDDLIERGGHVLLPRRNREQETYMPIITSDLADGEVAIGEIAEQAADRVDRVPAGSRVVDRRRLRAQSDVDE
jgi:hypothetical protein